MFSPLRKIGNSAEQVALTFLQTNRLTLVTKNYLTKLGEIDLIMLDNDTLVFIEVRYRENENFSSSVSTVNHIKQQKIIKTAHIFLQSNKKYQDNICRFDVVGVQNGLKFPTIKWIKSAFTL